ncbi:hypothetical protein ABBQ38_000810 [Trebouxia sp. C0009 RCD-2024]
MPFKGCYESSCPLQITRAFTTPLIATMSDGKLPDPRNIRNVMRASFDMTEWASVVEDVGAHPIGGMRFNSFRALAYKGQLYVSYATEIFDSSLPFTNDTKSDTFKMRFQGTGVARVGKEGQLHSVVVFAQPLIPRQKFPCCDKNWGMREFQGQLYIFYTILPVLSIFTMDLESPSHPELVHASYLTDEAATSLEQTTGLQMSDVRISGHPIMYKQYPETLLILVHHNWRRNNGSKHWAVQLQYESATQNFVITAISRHPVLSHQSFILHNESPDIMDVIAIGSYHIHQNRLRILFGDGDKYASYEDVCLSSIRWVHLDETSFEHWTEGPTIELGQKIDSITHDEYTKLVW